MIATTLRLWVQRHVLPARPQAAASNRRYQTGALLVAIVVVAVGIASVAFSLHNAGAQSPSPARHAAGPAKAATHSAAPLSSAALASADASRQQAASWVAAQVSQGIIVACDPLMCSALQRHGFPAADLATLGGAASDPMGSGIVMSTLAVRAQLGSELTRVYAPVVIASFGSGLSLVQVRVTAPGGAAAYLSAEHADLQARQVAGRTLAGNRNIRAPAAARAQLAAGQVDMRLMIILATLTHKVSSIQIRSFADAGPGAGSSDPLRMVTVITPSKTYLTRLLSFLHAQRPPLLPVISQHHRGRTTTVQIQFKAPSPTGLLSTGATQ